LNNFFGLFLVIPVAVGYFFVSNNIKLPVYNLFNYKKEERDLQGPKANSKREKCIKNYI